MMIFSFILGCEFGALVYEFWDLCICIYREKKAATK